MANELSKQNNQIAPKALAPEILEKLLLGGDLSVLDAKQKIEYYNIFCQRIGLDPVTKPFQILKLDGKEIMYADRGCTAQLTKLHKISHQIVSSEVQEIDGNSYYTVRARATNEDKQFLESIAVVPLFKEDGEWTNTQSGKKFFKKNGQLKKLMGDDMANAMMKAETKAKRRATLDIVGLGVIDESEAETMKYATYEFVEPTTPSKEEPQMPPMTDADKLYRTATGDVELITKLIDEAKDHTLLKTFQAINDKFFKTNDELNTRLKAKYLTLKTAATPKIITPNPNQNN